LEDCQWRRQRRAGPGGQHRNKVESGVFLRHLPTGLGVWATERRSQHENRRVALNRLRLKLAVEVRTPVDANALASRLWQSRCRNGRIVASRQHPDYPALLAEALDFLTAEGLDFGRAAGRLGCTRSQLTRFIKTTPEALALVNARRTAQNLPTLR
jgi:hypothetical protein